MRNWSSKEYVRALSAGRHFFRDVANIEYLRLDNDTSAELETYCEREGITSDQDTYDMVVANKPFRSSLVRYLGLALPTDPNLSNYGREFGISDFDLYFYCNTMSKATEHMNKLMPDKSFSEVSTILDALITKKKSIQSYLYRIRDQIIANMELPETPDFELVKRERTSREKKKQEEREKTEEDIRTEITKKLFTPAVPSPNEKTVVDTSFTTEEHDADFDSNSVAKTEHLEENNDMAYWNDDDLEMMISNSWGFTVWL